MPQAASMKVTGITGTGSQTSNVQGRPADSRVGDITVTGFTHEVKADIDPYTHKVTKQRTHSPLVVLKNIDVSSAALHKLQRDGTAVDLTLKLYHMPSNGPEFHYYSIHVTGAKIVSIKLVMPDVNAFDLTHEWEEVAFVYTGIAYEVMAADDKTEKVAYSGAKASEPEGALSKTIKFGPIWTEDKAKDTVKKAYEAAKDAAKKKFDQEVAIYEASQKKGK